MEVIAAFFAQTIRKSQDGAGTDIVGIFDGVTSDSFPYWNPNVRPLIGFTLNWNDNNQKYDLTFRVIDEDGKNIVADAHNSIFDAVPIAEGEYRTDWLMFDFAARLIFPKPGRYQFDTLLGDKVIKSAYIYFVEAKTTPQITIKRACLGEAAAGPNGPTPVNVFNSINIDRFPSEKKGRIPVFVEANIPLTFLGKNEGSLSAQLFDPRTNQRVADYNTFEMKPEQPIDTSTTGEAEVAVNLFLINPKFQTPGRYEVRIIAGNEVLFRLPLDVYQKS